MWWSTPHACCSGSQQQCEQGTGGWTIITPLLCKHCVSLDTVHQNVLMLLFINRLFFLDGESVGEPKSSEQWPVAVEKDYGYMAAMVADVSVLCLRFAPGHGHESEPDTYHGSTRETIQTTDHFSNSAVFTFQVVASLLNTGSTHQHCLNMDLFWILGTFGQNVFI